MTLDITLDSEAEEVILVVDDYWILKANRDASDNSLILNKHFHALKDEDEVLYRTLKDIASKLLLMG